MKERDIMIKTLSKSIREFKKESIQTSLFAMLEVLAEVFIPFFMAILIDKGVYGESLTAIQKYGLYMLLLVVCGLIFGVLAATKSSTAATGFARNLRQDLYFKIQNFSFSNIDKFSASSLITRLTTDVMNVQIAYMMIIRVAVRAPVMIIFSLIMAFYINTRLAISFLIMIPILGGALFFLIRIAHPYFQKVFYEYDQLNRVVQEDINGIRVVKSFVREDHERKKFQKVSTAIYNLFCKAEGIMALNSPVMQLVVYVTMLIIYWLGATIIVKSGSTELSTGELTTLISCAMQILTALMMLSTVLVLITIAQSSSERIVEVLDERIDIASPEKAIETVKDGSIEFDHVDLNYGKSSPILKDIDLRIPSGSIVGILGSTGSGKSSLVQLLPRLYDVSDGSVKIGGVDVRAYDLSALRNSVAMILQKNVLFSGTIAENLRWGNENATDEQVVHAAKLAQADEFINQFPDKYNTHIEQGGVNVSGGQRQRLCIARALLKDPKILILDDSTSAVDTKTDALIRRSFVEEIPNVTKVIIAQRISSIQDANIIIVMEKGNIEAIGTHEELLNSNKIYQEVYYSQNKGEEPNE